MEPARRMLVESCLVAATAMAAPVLASLTGTWTSTLALVGALSTVLVGAMLAWRSPLPFLPSALAALLAACALFAQYFAIMRTFAAFCVMPPCPPAATVGESLSAAAWPSLGVLLLGLSVAIMLQARRGRPVALPGHASA